MTTWMGVRSVAWLVLKSRTDENSFTEKYSQWLHRLRFFVTSGTGYLSLAA
jgi:hypothetical protein